VVWIFKIKSYVFPLAQILPKTSLKRPIEFKDQNFAKTKFTKSKNQMKSDEVTLPYVRHCQKESSGS
jgi:hypothetical protein